MCWARPGTTAISSCSSCWSWAAAALLATILHGLEALVWAIAYTLLGAVEEYHDAVLYSLNAITAYGHESIQLSKQWSLMGALEALNGLLLFGLITAFLSGHLQRVWPVELKCAERRPAQPRR